MFVLGTCLGFSFSLCTLSFSLVHVFVSALVLWDRLHFIFVVFCTPCCIRRYVSLPRRFSLYCSPFCGSLRSYYTSRRANRDCILVCYRICTYVCGRCVISTVAMVNRDCILVCHRICTFVCGRCVISTVAMVTLPLWAEFAMRPSCCLSCATMVTRPVIGCGLLSGHLVYGALLWLRVLSCYWSHPRDALTSRYTVLPMPNETLDVFDIKKGSFPRIYNVAVAEITSLMLMKVILVFCEDHKIPTHI